MTDDDKALVERLRDVYRVKVPNYIDDAADRIEALSAENERLREALEKIANESSDTWAKRDASAALGETK